MEINEYQEKAKETEIYTRAAQKFVGNITKEQVRKEKFLSLIYCVGKLNGEAGEIAEKVFKAFRDNEGIISDELRDSLEKELGDVQWYVANIADILEMDLEYIMEQNLDKLGDRKKRGVLSGSGDNR